MGDARDAPTPTHGSSPGSPAAARRAAIEHAYQLGVMNEEEYHSKMATQGRSCVQSCTVGSPMHAKVLPVPLVLCLHLYGIWGRAPFRR